MPAFRLVTRLRATALLAALALLATAGCGPFHRRSGADAYIQFVNQSIDQADVYVVPTGGLQTRIGTVTGNSTARLRIPYSVISGGVQVDIVARILASPLAPRTGPLLIDPTAPLQVTLPPQQNTLSVLPLLNP